MFIVSIFGHKVAPLTITRLRHEHLFRIWLLDDATGDSSKFGPKMAPLAIVPNVPTRWCQWH